MIDHIPDNLRKYGFYKVDDITFINKIEALKFSKKLGSPVSFHFNDEVFSSYDWTIDPEPNTSLSELYRRRAQELRDNNDYLVLAYSGGPDSQNVLDSFLKNNIHIDEIVNFNSYESTGIVNNTIHNADYYYNVKPNIEKIYNEHGSKIKYTTVDEVSAVKTFWNEARIMGNHGMLFGTTGFPSTLLYRGMWVKLIPHIWKKILNGDKVKVMYGADKPYIGLHNNKHFVSFGDMYGDTINMLLPDKDFNGRDLLEFFYHSPDCPKIVIKQAHVLKQYMDFHSKQDDYEDPSIYITDATRSPLTCTGKNNLGNLKYGLYHKLIYPDWNPNFITPKEGRLGTRPTDNWWISQFTDQEKSVWTYGLGEQFKLTLAMKELKVDNIHKSIPALSSKKYFLEK